MRKMLSVIFAAALISAGLAAFVGSPAQAACPYTGCIETSTKISVPDRVDKGTRARVGVRVTSAGNAEPKGDVTVRVMRKNGGYTFVDSADYRGGKVWFRTTNLPIKGVYVVKARYDKKAGSRWKNSRNEVEFRVVRP